MIALLLGLLACGRDDLTPIHGTTVRVAPPTTPEGATSELKMHLFADEDECVAGVDPADVDACVPFVDRASGQVRVAFEMRVSGENWRVPLSEENIEIFHMNQRVLKNGARMDYEVVPHDPKPGEQLFILLIDASGSMAIDDEGKGRTRMDKVKAALLRKDVVDAFFPGNVETAVVPLVFRGGPPEPLGGKWMVDNRKDYRQLVQDALQVGSGYTYLYRSIEYASTTLLENIEIKKAIENKKMQPTVIALTDGFNDENPADTCASNVPRLEALLKKLDGARRGAGTNIRYAPQVFTVGLGRKAWGNWTVPETRLSVSTRDLCKGKGAEVIDGGIERRGVDNAALAWVAEVGGGASYISRTTDGLADAFKAAAAMRYRWFEVRYRVDPFFLRRGFLTKLRIGALYGAEASMSIQPSGWLDAPPGEVGADGWTTRPRYARVTTLVFPALGLLTAFGYLPAAFFNVRRALFSRVARKTKRKG